jgi:predicted ABC-type ATPase
VATLRPPLICIAGPNGAGKTTVTARLRDSDWGRDVLYVNPDDIAQNEFLGWNDPDSIKKAADLAELRRREAVAQLRPLAFETVFSTVEKLQFVLGARNLGYFVRLFFIGTSGPDINAGRIAARYVRGGHAVPIEKIVSRYAKSVANAAVAAPNVDRFYLYDNSIDQVDARLVFRASDGVLAKTYGDIPQWAEQIFCTLKRPT